MADIIKVYRETRPALTLVGKVYHNVDRDEHGSFSAKWGEWFRNGLFEKPESSIKPYGDTYVGAMRMVGDVFEYWIGILTTDNAEIPEGFTRVELPAGDYGVTWIHGKDDAALYSMHEASLAALADAGMTPAADAWYIESYVCPRFTTPDENGEVILDYLVKLKD